LFIQWLKIPSVQKIAIAELQEINAQLCGHRNAKQKIQYLLKVSFFANISFHPQVQRIATCSFIFITHNYVTAPLQSQWPFVKWIFIRQSRDTHVLHHAYFYAIKVTNSEFHKAWCHVFSSGKRRQRGSEKGPTQVGSLAAVLDFEWHAVIRPFRSIVRIL
jgi:hypothetical protein